METTEAQPQGYPERTWNDVTTEGLISTIHSQHRADLPWARAAAREYERRMGRSPLHAWCVCPWCKEARG